MKEVYRLVRRVAPTDLPVLIEGETGTGKELVARAVHALSDRADGPFVDINCAAIPENLIESELFGCEKGAFTGATQRVYGLLEQADGGTLFLDEACSLSKPAQAKLLRALERLDFRRVGGRAVIRSDFRLVVAVSRPIQELLGAGEFRMDFAFRVAAIAVHLPALRDRGGDIRLLAQVFLDQECSAEGRTRRWREDALAIMTQHHWPGNVRELEMLAQRVSLLTEHDLLGLGSSATVSLHVLGDSATRRGLGAHTARVKKTPPDRATIVAALGEHRGVVSQAARALGLERRALYRLLKASGVSLTACRYRP